MNQGFLTTHVLDTYSGKPGRNIKVELYYISKNVKKINTIRLNKHGRSEKPLMKGKKFIKGQYELVFYVSNYFNKITKLTKPPFLDTVSIKFGVANSDQHYHIPLLVSPWSYTTYRGS